MAGQMFKSLSDSDVKRGLHTAWLEPTAGSPEYPATQLRQYIARRKAIVIKANIKVEHQAMPVQRAGHA